MMNPEIEPVRRPTRRRRKRGKISSFLEKIYRILKGSFLTFTMTKGAESSAALAYYTLFSLFPLLLIFVSVGSFFVDKSVVEKTLIDLLPSMLPISQDFIVTNVQEIFINRGAITILAFLGLIWSATAVFTVVMRNINSAWPGAAPRSYLRMRLLSLAVVVALALLLILSIFTITLKNLLINFGLSQAVDSMGAIFSSPVTGAVFGTSIRVFIFFGLYYWTPQIKVKKVAAIIGAVVTAFLWQLISILFSAYLSSGMAGYEVIYGSLGKIVALLAWVYFSALTVLFGAHLTSSIDRYTI